MKIQNNVSVYEGVVLEDGNSERARYLVHRLRPILMLALILAIAVAGAPTERCGWSINWSADANCGEAKASIANT